MATSFQDESFRDTIGTLDEKGKRKFLFPKKPSGKFYDYRKTVSYILLLILIVNPFIKVNGNQFMLFNILERRFNIFGVAFWPQDLYLFVIVMITMVVFIILFTVVFGRIFCGWICPQTIFLEMVFRRIEYWIDGDRNAQIKLNKQVWNAEKIKKRVAKWLIFFVISFLIANVFLAYIIGSDELLLIVRQGPAAHVSKFISLLIFTSVFYFIFVWFREQVCIIACPYGRLQGVLLDNKSINVAYDFVRGEKTEGRGKIIKSEDRAASGKGDCIDCKLCVHVCPMGIDIRNGIQLECTNCTACIDECATVMESVGFPKGLIRYASEDEIVKKEKFRFTARMKGYTTVLFILLGILSGMLFLRNDIDVNILRLPGQLFTHEGENISNVYTYKIVNKSNDHYDDIHFEIISHEGKIIKVGTTPNFSIKKHEMVQGTIFIQIPEHILKSEKTNVKIAVYNSEKLLQTITTNFLGPRTF